MRPAAIVLGIYFGMAAAPALAAEPAITIKPIQIISQAEVPAGAPDEARSIMFNKGFTIGYLVEGRDLIGFADGSLAIASITTADGRNIAKKRNGETNYEMGPFPKASDDGKFAFFQIQSDEHLFGQVEGLVVTGTITVRTGSELTTATTKAHGLTSKEVEHIGEFDVTFGQAKEGGISFHDGGESVSIVVAGPLAKITKVKLLVDGKAVDESGSMGVKGAAARTFQFEKPAGASGTVEIAYWKNLSETPVAFGGK